MKIDSRVFLAGHQGLIGSAIGRRLKRDGYTQVLTPTRSELDLSHGPAVSAYFEKNRPEYVILAAGRVGGITANLAYPADFISENLAMQLNVMSAAHDARVRRLLFFGSSCMYPRECPQPMAEGALLTGVPETTSLPYAMAKLAGVQMCLAFNQQFSTQFIPVIPNNAYGPWDDFDPKSSHVLSALLRRFHEAKVSGASEVLLWGTGKPRREFIYSDDIADACLFILRQGELPKLPLNIGSGVDCSIQDLAETIARTVGFTGRVGFDTSKPDGAPRKLLDSSRLLALGWNSRVTLDEGLRKTYDWYLTEGMGAA